MGGRLLLPLSLTARMKGEGNWKSGEMLFYYLGGGGGGREKEENYGGGEINPLPTKAEKQKRLHHPPRSENVRGPPSYEGAANLPTHGKEFWGLKRPWRGRERRPEPTLSRGSSH